LAFIHKDPITLIRQFCSIADMDAAGRRARVRRGVYRIARNACQKREMQARCFVAMPFKSAESQRGGARALRSQK
jgi:hypothetical protein